MNELLARKMNPKSLADVVGQRHLIGENKILSNLVKNGKFFQ
jgi:replication-associated recombination protein RarA